MIDMYNRHKKFIDWSEARTYYDPRHAGYLSYIKSIATKDINTLRNIRILLGIILQNIFIFNNGDSTPLYERLSGTHNDFNNIIDMLDNKMEELREEREEHTRSRWEYENGY
jgi:hypothetical protein